MEQGGSYEKELADRSNLFVYGTLYLDAIFSRTLSRRGDHAQGEKKNRDKLFKNA